MRTVINVQGAQVVAASLLLIGLVTILLLSGCSDRVAIADAAIANIDTMSATHLEPIAALDTSDTITEPDAYIYSSQSLRSPFMPLSVLNKRPAAPATGVIETQPVEVTPTLPVQKTIQIKHGLERYQLQQLHYRGSMTSKTNVLYGLVERPDGLIARVQVDDKLGPYNGRIVAITANHIEIVEQFLDPQGGQLEQPAFLRSFQ